jgi:GAF domain-containing protein/nitrogen-specific signal transduction histidine kinase
MAKRGQALSKARAVKNPAKSAVNLKQENAALKRELAQAMEELRESLERQTATSEVLQAINASPGDLTPVFEAMLDKALALCDAVNGIFWTFHGDQMRIEAVRGNVAAAPHFFAVGRFYPIGATNAQARLIRGERFVHILDVAEDYAYRAGDEVRRATVEIGCRTLLALPLRKEGLCIGAFIVDRTEVKPFTERQIALLENFAAQAIIAMENARLLGELRQRTGDLEESLKYQTATSDVLKVISRSTFDLQPILDTLVETAARLCQSDTGLIAGRDGDVYRGLATFAYSPEYAAFWRDLRLKPTRATITGRVAIERRVIHIVDTAADPDYVFPESIKLGKNRTLLGVPLLRKGEPIGVVSFGRERVEPFTERQIELVRTFADQAVIAIENARLIAETREALEQQTATADVLKLISRATFDLQPVLDTLVETAARLCNADAGSIWRQDGDGFRAIGVYGFQEDAARLVRASRLSPGRGTVTARTVLEGRPIHILDVRQDPEYTWSEIVERAGLRAMLGVPMIREGTTIGAFSLHRMEARPFTDKQIELVATFADQAVIAIENARLITETREALERQTATAEVLQVINVSPGNLAPVFDAILERAMRVCGAAFGGFGTYGAERFAWVAERGVPPLFSEYVATHEASPGPRAGFLRVARGDGYVHFPDIRTTKFFHDGEPFTRAVVELGGGRTTLSVPLVKNGEVLGVFGFFRQEVRPFSEREIALLVSFAAQAVIAMENARLLGELRTRTDDLEESLEYQTATSDVLKVISRSTFDLQPVLDTLIETAAQLCETSTAALAIRQGDEYRYVATARCSPEYDQVLRSRSLVPSRGAAAARVLLERKVVHIIDATTDPDYNFAAAVNVGKIRTILGVPMFRADEVVGVIALAREHVKPFTERQIELVRTFAAQAVIAMENARLLGELRESLEQQTATAEVLGVISSAPGQLQPVFEKLLESALRLCGAHFGSINRVIDGVSNEVVRVGASPEIAFTLTDYRPPPHSPYGQMLATKSTVQVRDYAETQAYAERAPAVVALVEQLRGRSALQVPLVREDEVIGSITIYRPEVRPFADKEVALVENFARQGVIAIENARLLSELRESLEQQTATSEVLQVINASPGDLKPVFDAILEKAHHLCGATNGLLVIRNGEYFHTVSSTRALRTTGAPTEDDVELLQRPFQAMPNTPYARLYARERIFHLPDVVADTQWNRNDPRRAKAIEQGLRTMLLIPLRKDNALLGYISACRHEVRPFSDKEIKLLESFAAQAVIAMENARLLSELRTRTNDLQESLEYQTATSDVLKVISRSTFDLQSVFDALADTAARLCAADMVFIYRRDGEVYRLAANIGFPPAYEAFIRGIAITPGRESVTGRAALERQAVQVVDIAADPDYVVPETIELGRARTVLGVPLLREGEPVGVIALARQRVEPFTERQIELVRTFADQAVIAMENARLLGELRESLEQQTATAEVLQIINTSQGELKPVFDAILDKALRLSHSAFGTMRTFDGTRFHLAAEKDVPQAYLDFTAKRITNVGLVGVDALGPAVARVITSKRVFQIVDTMEDDDLYRKGDPMRRAVADLAGARTILFVPLINDDVARGTIMVFRTEVQAYSEKEIALLQNFAAQAVIAMDNARLLGELRERQAELRVTFDNMGDGVALFDAEPRLVAWNRNFQNILDLPDALLAQRLTYVEYIKMLADRGEFGTLDNIEAELARRMETLDRPALFARTRPDGKVIEARRNPVPGGGFVLIYSDITERKRAEAEISAARDAAETALAELKSAQANLIQAEKMASLGQLTAGIAHEIKNPLNFVNNFAALSNELLDELKEIAGAALETLGEDRRAELGEVLGMLSGNLGKIAEHGRRADGIVKSMLAHSRGGSGDRQTVDLNALVEESLNLAYHGARAQDQNFNITMERELDPAMKPVELVPQDITRVFLNLFGNGFYAASKRSGATGDGGFRPVLRVATRDTGDAVEVRVRDNGIGIPPGIREKLFQPFFTTKPTGEGTGLGLSISYDIVTQQHGGTISVDSKEGVFTEFTVRLPRGWQAPPARGDR